MKELLLVFDKDGVIIDSESAKLTSIEGVFIDNYPQFREAIHDYNHQSIGIPRKVKFEHICRNILELENWEAVMEKYAGLYTQEVNEQLKKIPLVSGIREYLSSRNETKFVCSAAPYPEVVQNIKDHHLGDFFEELYAFPSPKAEVMLGLKKRYQAEIVFWGDTMADYRASVDADVHFIGVTTAEVNPFLDLDIPTIPDFSDQKALQDIIGSFRSG